MRTVVARSWHVALNCGFAALSIVSAAPARAQGSNSQHGSTTIRIGGFVPLRPLGTVEGMRSYLAPGLSMGVSRDLSGPPTGIGFRAGADLVVLSGIRSKPSDGCLTACSASRDYEGMAVVFTGALMSPSVSRGRTSLRAVLGGGAKAYLFPFPKGDCLAFTDAGCRAQVAFAKNRVEPTLYFGAALNRGGRVGLELGDYLSRYKGNNTQHDLLFSLNWRLGRK